MQHRDDNHCVIYKTILWSIHLINVFSIECLMWHGYVNIFTFTYMYVCAAFAMCRYDICIVGVHFLNSTIRGRWYYTYAIFHLCTRCMVIKTETTFACSQIFWSPQKKKKNALIQITFTLFVHKFNKFSFVALALFTSLFTAYLHINIWFLMQTSTKRYSNSLFFAIVVFHWFYSSLFLFSFFCWQYYINVCRPLVPQYGLSCAGNSAACRAINGTITPEKEQVKSLFMFYFKLVHLFRSCCPSSLWNFFFFCYHSYTICSMLFCWLSYTNGKGKFYRR